MMEICKFMDWSDILSFGLTNKKNFIFVKYHIQIKNGSVKLNIDHTQNLANIFNYYGNCFKTLNLNFHKIASVFTQRLIPTFVTEDESFNLDTWLSSSAQAHNFIYDYYVTLNKIIK